MTSKLKVKIFYGMLGLCYGEVRAFTVLGKENLTDAAWHSPTNAADRFFKVSVEMP